MKYFSGAGNLHQDVRAGGVVQERCSPWIDLGDVKNLAEVTVNGKSLGVVWHTPYRVDATSAMMLVQTESIKVVNTWVNRLIGDEQPGVKENHLYRREAYKANSPLQSSGLLGPVSVKDRAGAR